MHLPAVRLIELPFKSDIVDFRTNFARVILIVYDHISAGRESFEVLG